jgi:hypothetical protein
MTDIVTFTRRFADNDFCFQFFREYSLVCSQVAYSRRGFSREMSVDRARFDINRAS